MYAGVGVGYGSGLHEHLLANVPIFQTQNPEYTINIKFHRLQERAAHHAAVLREVIFLHVTLYVCIRMYVQICVY